jgi:hypothetical protein
MIRSGLVAALCLGCAVTAFAHHGAGSFDLRSSVTHTGILTSVEFINPHSWLYFDVTDESGRVTKHRCEMRSAHTLRRSGWATELFPIGQRVVIEASPDREDPNSCYLNTIKFEDGSNMDRYGQYVKGPEGGIREVRGPVTVPDVSKRAYRRPNGEPNITGDWAPEQVVMANPRGTGGGLVPLSQIGERPAEQPDGARAGGGRPAGARAGGARAGGARAGGARRGGGPGGGPRLFGGTELTEAGQRAAAAFTQADNPRFRCETTSILFDWTFDGPVNRIVQTTNSIVILYGQLGLRRTIHMNMDSHPETVEPSRAGHSIGRWEDDVLVVDTVGFLPGILNGSVHHSDRLRVVERFSLDPETMKLTRSYTATDPVHLKGEYTGSDVIQVADAPYADDNCKEQGFIDFSETAAR